MANRSHTLNVGLKDKLLLLSFFSSNYPNVKINVVGVDGGDATSGSYIGGIGPGSQITSCGDTYTIQIAR